MKRLFVVLILLSLGCSQADQGVVVETESPGPHAPFSFSENTADTIRDAGGILIYGGELRGYLKPCGCTTDMLDT